MEKPKQLLDEKTEREIRAILRRGNTVELKKINGAVRVIEIERRKRAQTQYSS